MDGNPQRLDIVTPVSPTGEVREIELDLVPSLIKAHGHCANEGLHSCSRLVVAGPKPSADIFVIEYLHLEGEVFLELHVIEGTFLIIMTRKGSLIPRVSLASCGHVM